MGAVSWRPVAERLPDAIAADYGVVCGPDWYEGVATRVAAQAGEGPWLAVLHSGAGGFAPALADASSDLAGFIFVDAVLPYPGKTCLENAPGPLQARLRELADEGLLRPWNRWFDADPLPRLLPDKALRTAFERDLPRVPFDFLEVLSASSDGWALRPAAYLQLSKVYEDTATRAEQRGWPVRRVRLHHLAMASDPQEVAGLLAELVGALS